MTTVHLKWFGEPYCGKASKAAPMTKKDEDVTCRHCLKHMHGKSTPAITAVLRPLGVQ